VSTIPTSYGEKVTIRILDQEGANRGLEDLQLADKIQQAFENVLSKPQGIILVTGPTGSGKSSTLYACLNRLNSPETNIVTVEDPIEFDVPGVNQVQIHPQAGITFPAGLRSILRQDPDIVMVGEIRDSETATIALQAGQTGHLVLSTLHTNDAPSSIVRLLDLGIQPFLVSASLVAVVGQRLVRRICEKCKAPDPLSAKLVEQLAPYLAVEKDTMFWKGNGCEACQYTGYLGRLGIFEFLTVSPSLKEVIAPNISAITLKRAAEKEGFESMAADGIRKAIQGLTTIAEVYRVSPPEVDDASNGAAAVSDVVEIFGAETFQADSSVTSVSNVQPKKILIVEDNEVTVKLLCNFLESANYSVITAGDGTEALKLAVREKPDLIVTDLVMPQMDGAALIEKLKSQLTTRYIPIIMLTVVDSVESEVKVIDAGADDYITKPVNAKKLIARVNRLISRPPLDEICSEGIA
jgi:type IV pilus assembly protein PilB